MRVLIAGHTGMPFGGITTYCETLLDSGIRQRVNLSFVDTSVGNLSFSKRGRWGFNNLANSVLNICNFVRELLKQRPDIVHIVTAHGVSFYKHGLMALAARLAGSKVVLHPHCSISQIVTPSDSFYRRFCLFVLRHSDGVVGLSEEWLLLQKSISTPVVYIPNGIQTSPYLELSRPVNTHKTRIIYLGHFSEEKGLFDLISAAQIILEKTEEFEIVCYGEATQLENEHLIRAVIQKTGIEKYFRLNSPVFFQEKLSALEQADIYVLPSHHEGMPVSILEAMASGLPVVATDVGGIPNIIVPGVTGYLVPANSAKALADALTNLILNPLLRISIGKAGRKDVMAKFDIESHVNSLHNFYCLISA